ncbi:DUF1254 domain-containing protein [Nocardia tengchongensis]|uniref:DUF1254 domain-containing protein n=1 Tax=Nocardia tengchongensis TaxID=2055889 RepID=UPI003620EE2D
MATDAYVFGYPLVLMDATHQQSLISTPNNRWVAVPPLDPTINAVVDPNVDTIYTSAWVDLKREPVVVEIPEITDRYWLMQVLDAWSNTVGDPSSIDPKDGKQNGGHTYALTGPNFSGTVPEGMTRVPITTNTAWLIDRTEYHDEADIANAQAAQGQMRMATLSEWESGERPTPLGNPPINSAVPPPGAVAKMNGPAFFGKLNALMVDNPPAADDAPAMKRFAGIGVTPGGTVDSALAADLSAGVQAGKDQITGYKNPGAKNENGWAFNTNQGAYGTDYPLRAYTARGALGENLPKDAVYPTVEIDAGTPDAPKRYVMKFAAGKTPPVKGFWSLTAYTPEGYLVPNPAGIYSVGHQVPVVPGPDGSVELVIQAADPGPAVPHGNWLPISESGKGRLMIRLYAADPQALDGTWQLPAVTQVS